MVWDIVVACKKVFEHMIEEYNNAPKCELCGIVGYNYNSRIFDYLYYLETRERAITREMYEPIMKYVFEHYPYQEYGNLTRHHISYEKGICMFVCSSCHGKIHGDPESKYKPIDKKPKRKKVKHDVYKTLN